MSILKKLGIIIFSFIVILILSLTILTSSLVTFTDKGFISETSLSLIKSSKADILTKLNLDETKLKEGINTFCSNPELMKTLESQIDNPQFSNLESQIDNLDIPKYVDQKQLADYKNNINTFNQLKDLGLTCDKIQGKSSDEIISTVVPTLINTYYEKDYQCDYLECIQSGSSEQILGSTFNKKGHDFFTTLFWILLIISLALLVIIFLLSESRISGLMNIGINLTLAGTGFIGILLSKSVVSTMLPQDPLVSKIAADLISKIFSIIQNKFLTVFIIGLLFIAVSIILRFIKPNKIIGGITK